VTRIETKELRALQSMDATSKTLVAVPEPTLITLLIDFGEDKQAAIERTTS
jgi:hypothetical protein